MFLLMASVQKLRTANLYDRCRGAWEGSARLQMETWHQDSVPFYKECVTFFFPLCFTKPEKKMVKYKICRKAAKTEAVGITVSFGIR